MWYTHKNPYGCWICDLIFILEQLRAETVHKTDSASEQGQSAAEEGINTKSTEL